jgi:O-antigen ligase
VQPYFFSSFIYHNHWGAFTVLMVAICLGLVFHFARRGRSRNFWHSPGFGGLIAIALLIVTIPLSGSRSCSVLIALFLLGAFARWLVRFTHERRRGGFSVVWPIAAASIALIAAGYFAYDLARPMIEKRLANTQVDIETLRANPAASTRLKLYRDTWLMAQERPWFGWGMASYPTVFYLRNSQRYPIPHLSNQVHFHDAHCDWLQSLSEVGFVGTALLGLCALVPIYHRRRGLRQSPLTTHLLAGLGLILLYAWLEFPFGNGAVIVAFWVCLFCAVHYPHCENTRGQS